MRSLLKEGGGWERLHTELKTGTGLGANMSAGERKALIDRFEAQRTRLAQEVTTAFSGEIVTTGSQLEVRFIGEDGPRRLQDAKAYLDAKQPGWEQRTGVKLEAPPPPREAGLVATAAKEGQARTVGTTQDGGGTVKETPGGEILVCRSPCLLMERNFDVELRVREDLRSRLAEIKKMAHGPARDAAEVRLEADLKTPRGLLGETFATTSETKLQQLVNDPTRPADSEADAALELRYQEKLGNRAIPDLVRSARLTRNKWESHYARRVLESGRGRRSSFLEYLQVSDLVVLRDVARYDPEAFHALERRYTELNQQQLETIAATGDVLANEILQRAHRGPRMNSEAEARLVEGMWERRRQAMDQAERRERQALAKKDFNAADVAADEGYRAASKGTLGALETDIPGLGGQIVRGSPEAPQGRGAEGNERRFFQPPGDQPTQAQFHAEERLLNALHAEIEKSRLRPKTSRVAPFGSQWTRECAPPAQQDSGAMRQAPCFSSRGTTQSFESRS